MNKPHSLCAVIVAAGLSSRLYPITQDLPKPLLPIGGESILSRSVSHLKANGIEQIYVVVGYLKHQIMTHLGDSVTYIHNPFYEHSNNMGSLWCTYPWVSEQPFVYLHGDVIYHPDLLSKIIESPPSFGTLLVEFGPVDEEAMKVRTQNGFMMESSKNIPLDEAQGEWIGIARFSAKASGCLFRAMDTLLGQGYLTSYDTLAFSQFSTIGTQIEVISTNGLPWVEVDDSLDLQHARAIFT